MMETEKLETQPQAQEAPPQAEQPQEPDFKAEFEKLKAKYEKAQADLQKFRTRAEEVEAAKRQAEQEALARKPLEEQLQTYKTQLEQIQQERERLARESQLKDALLEAGADPKKLKEAAEYYLFQASRMGTGQEPLDLKEWLKQYPIFLPAQPQPQMPPSNGYNAKTGKPFVGGMDDLEQLAKTDPKAFLEAWKQQQRGTK